jgi:hypothetical protein
MFPIITTRAALEAWFSMIVMMLATSEIRSIGIPKKTKANPTSKPNPVRTPRKSLSRGRYVRKPVSANKPTPDPKRIGETRPLVCPFLSIPKVSVFSDLKNSQEKFAKPTHKGYS